MTAPIGLPALEAELARQRSLLNLPPKAWMPETTSPDGEEVLDVAIVGAGLCGLAANAALAMEGVFKVRLYDRAPKDREGPWITYARMETLRTVKEAAGPALGIPALTFRAWFEAQWGTEAWDKMDLAPREMWMDYMIWYREMTGADVVNDCDVSAITPEGALFRLTTAQGDVLARRVVLATGLDALGAPRLPEAARGLPRGKVYHSADAFDVTELAGKRVIVVGAGASAMDNAATALEAGCARMDLLVRRAAIPVIDKFTGTGSRGMTAGYVGLPDDAKWDLMNEGDRFPVPPPKHSVERVARHSNAHLHLGAAFEAVEETTTGIRVTTRKGVIEADVAIFATGFGVALDERPELSAFAPHIRTWGDVVGPTRAAQNPVLAAHPYLGDDFAFQEKTSGSCPALARLTCFAYAAVPSHGKVTSGIPSASEGARRLASGLVRSLFAEDAERHLDRFRAFDTPDMTGEEWLPSDMAVTV
ncbi:FAD-dependent oxidoreductase (plasmid) [Salipiger sp. CCB-MM3]|uniref:NAD(P)-binding domain-containing protein n=1 Tax=Salipiger sp. CCB-MM3 TaxID=1792508 RepID=UPI00080AA572|nr:NAD(P)/FAD-dependent oxidoreductase [Salipiger sp. CCB-MM3]ANT63578.1 FAD-dependent oxidoreductase [Salipiger sp. CCB-MM3]